MRPDGSMRGASGLGSGVWFLGFGVPDLGMRGLWVRCLAMRGLWVRGLGMRGL